MVRYALSTVATSTAHGHQKHMSLSSHSPVIIIIVLFFVFIVMSPLSLSGEMAIMLVYFYTVYTSLAAI